MRNFFINSFEILISVFIILMIIAVVILGLATMFAPDGGFLVGLAVLVGGALSVILYGGILYLFVGIHANTKRTAELLEQMVNRP